MDGDSGPNEPGPSRNIAGGPHFMSERMDLVPPSRPRDEDDDSEYGVRRSISCEQLADWNAQLYEKSYVKCPLPNCGIMFHGATQIQNHYVNCTGRCEDAIIECNHCQAIVTTDQIQQHLKIMHRLDQSPQPSSDSGSSEVARATGIMERECRPGQKSGGSSVVGAEEEEGRDFQMSETCVETKDHHSFKFVNQDQMERQWVHELSVSGCATCPMEGCHLTFPSMSGIIQHFQHCLGKSQEAFICELCSKRFATGRMLNDHMMHIHGDDRVNIRVRNLDASVPDYNMRRRVVEGEDSERRRSGNGHVFNPLSVEEEVGLKSTNERHWKQRDYILVSSAHESESSLNDCYLPQHQTSQSVYNVPKNHTHHRDISGTGPSTYNIASSRKTHHSVPKPHRLIDYEKNRIPDTAHRYEPPSAFHRVKDRNPGEPRILKVYDIDSQSSIRISGYPETGVLYGEKEDLREPISSEDPFFRPTHNQPMRSFVRKVGTRSPVYPSTSGVKRKYSEEHCGNVYETTKSRKYVPTVSYTAGYTSDESEEDGRLHPKYERRVRHSPVMFSYPRPVVKTEVYSSGGRPVRRDQSYNANFVHNMKTPYIGFSKKESTPTFERPLIPDESSYGNTKCCMWEEDENEMFAAPVHMKKRELAERAQQLRRAEEAVKQQEEEAQQRTWRALREQELALKEKEEALKQREVAAQKKFEEATRMMEETRKLGDSKKFKEDKNFAGGRPSLLLSVNKRSNSASSHHSNEESGSKIYLNTVSGPADVTKRADSSLELQDRPQVECSDSESVGILRVYRPESFDHELGNSSISDITFPRLSESSADKSVLNIKTLSVEDENGLSKSHKMRSLSPTCTKSSSTLLVCGNKKLAYPWQTSEVIPSIEPSKVLRTYSRIQRRRTLTDSFPQTSSNAPLRAQSLTPNSKIFVCGTSFKGQKEDNGETVINGGATVTITPLMPSERPRRPYSAMPNMQPSGHTDCSESPTFLRSRPTSALENRIDIPVSITVTKDDKEISVDSPINLHLDNVKIPFRDLKVVSADSNLVENEKSKVKNILVHEVDKARETVARKGSNETCITLEKGEPCSRGRKGRKLSMISLAGVSIPGQIPTERTWKTGIKCHGNWTSSPSLQIFKAKSLNFDSSNDSARICKSSEEFDGNMKISGQYSNTCLDLSIAKSSTHTKIQDAKPVLATQNVAFVKDQNSPHSAKQLLVPYYQDDLTSKQDKLDTQPVVSSSHSLMDLSLVSNPASQTPPFTVESHNAMPEAELPNSNTQEPVQCVQALNTAHEESCNSNRESVVSPCTHSSMSLEGSYSPHGTPAKEDVVLYSQDKFCEEQTRPAFVDHIADEQSGPIHSTIPVQEEPTSNEIEVSVQEEPSSIQNSNLDTATNDSLHSQNATPSSENVDQRINESSLVTCSPCQNQNEDQTSPISKQEPHVADETQPTSHITGDNDAEGQGVAEIDTDQLMPVHDKDAGSEEYINGDDEQEPEVQTPPEISQESQNMGQEVEQTCQEQEMSDKEWLVQDQKWHLQNRDHPRSDEHSVQEMQNFAHLQELCSSLPPASNTGIEGEENSQITSKEVTNTYVTEEQGHQQQEQDINESHIKREGTNVNFNVTVTESTSHIIGEFDPSTGTFISSNPVLLKSILGNTVTYPLTSVPEGTFSPEFTSQITQQLPVINQVKQVSVQSQTEEVQEQGKYTHDQCYDMERQTHSNFETNIESSELEEKQSYISQAYVDNYENQDVCQGDVVVNQSVEQLNTSFHYKMEDSLAETKNGSLVEKHGNVDMGIAEAEDEEDVGNDADNVVEDMEVANCDESTDVGINFDPSDCMTSEMKDSHSEMKDNHCSTSVDTQNDYIEMPDNISDAEGRNPDSTILYPPIYVSLGISEDNAGNMCDKIKGEILGEVRDEQAEIGGTEVNCTTILSPPDKSDSNCRAKGYEMVNCKIQKPCTTEAENNVYTSERQEICTEMNEDCDISFNVQDESNKEGQTRNQELGVSQENVLERQNRGRGRGRSRRRGYRRGHARSRSRGRSRGRIKQSRSGVSVCAFEEYSNTIEELDQHTAYTNYSKIDGLENVFDKQSNNGETAFIDMGSTASIEINYKTHELPKNGADNDRKKQEAILNQNVGKCVTDQDHSSTMSLKHNRESNLCNMKSPDCVENSTCKTSIGSEVLKVEEERIEHVSRGGRKLKLKDWWTGVVTDSLAPRNRTSSVSKSPRSSSGKSPIRSPPHSSAPRQLLFVKEERRTSTCQEECQENDNSDINVSQIGSTLTSDTELQDITASSMSVVRKRETTLNHEVNINPKKKGRSSKTESQSLPVEEIEIKCGKCDVICNSRAHFNLHIQLEHNGLARPDGEDQTFTEIEVKEILKKTIKNMKKLKCEVCSNFFRSLLGYRRHSEACGKSDEEVNIKCTICNKELRYYCMPAHMRTVHAAKKVDPKKVEKKTEEIVSTASRPRRRAAANCNERLKVWRSNRTGESGSENSDAEEDFNIELEADKFYSKPEFADIPEEVVLKWESQLSTGVDGCCSNEGCTFIFSSVPQAKSHFNVCLYSAAKQMFTCKNCEYTSQTEREMVSHVTTIHLDLTGGAEEESDYDLSDDDCEESYRQTRSYGRMNQGQLKPFEPAMRWTFEFLKDSISEDNLFLEYFTTKDKWIMLDEEQYLKFLPSVKQSPRFKVKQAGKTNNITGDWTNIQQFTGQSVGGTDVIFCGGPVISSCWCPQPQNVSLGMSPQYLALSTLKSPEKEYPILKSTLHEGLIQIWECTSEGKESGKHLKFVFGIAHEFGNVWSLAWCPSGAYEHLEGDLASSQLKRLGLLAAAFSDGFIRIYVIPHPSDLDLHEESKIFQLQPKVTLSPGKMYKDEAQCLHLDWYQGKGHADIAGALSDGVVCVWDIRCKSPLLYSKDVHDNFTIYPRNSFQAHNGVCSVVAFCNTTGGRNLVTGGNDRTYKFWDLENTDMPLCINRRGLVLDAVWLAHWAGCFVSFDDVYGLSNTSTSFRECGFFGIQSRNVLSSNAPVWSLSGSEWLNAVVQGDSAGEVVITIQQQLFRNYENDKFPSKRKVPLLSVRLEDLDQGSQVSFKPQEPKPKAAEKPNPKMNKKSKKSRPTKDTDDEFDDDDGDELCPAAYIEWPHSYMETCEKYGIVFTDQNTQDFSKIPASEMAERKRSNSMEPGPVACYPLMAATSVAWNNNLGAHTWIFVGTQSGLCKVIQVSALNTSEGEKVIKKYSKS
ncbi:uncharacterized protein LOC125030435 isoform X2 [Penaeus chinensis]|uniref:uncharacterized protein LOC125030435 isoform X2 n=1 Tax=Penaeus chinensis TaxID=139456 RepID=UPI001FB59F80|nr:uncharacterized protein LOC125030435 isoform X2 [Penaeus chinensis]